MPNFEIPVTVKAYFEDQATREVVDTLMSMLDDPILPDMNRDKLINLSEGVLLTCQVRTDFIGFMVRLWKEIFEQYVTKNDLMEVFHENCTIKEVWADKHFWSYVSRSGGLKENHFDLSVIIEGPKHKIKLYVWQFNSKDKFQKFPSKCGIPDGWRNHVENDEIGVVTTLDLTMEQLVKEPDIEVKKLRDAAGKIMEFINQVLSAK